MISATANDTPLILDILTHSFNNNKSVNYLIKQDQRRAQRLKALLKYSIQLCRQFGHVYLSDDRKACALVMLPDKKKTTPRTIIEDLRLALALGWSHSRKAMSREAAIKKLHPKEPFYYLWFIGVDPAYQQQGIGSSLLKELMEEAKKKQRPVYLETSTINNIPWYEKMGFSIYNQLDFGYPISCMRYLH
jgi:ribosomal protein S18 acetylase RimI-like enzyme